MTIPYGIIIMRQEIPALLIFCTY
uniref:Uncharacterized protein n=1 Tax=Arundo donax TaxID=35708 RepID=A0A0A9FY62_ARUDO